MITRETFMTAVRRIRTAYNNNNFLSSSQAMGDWYRIFENCNEWSFEKAIDRCMTEVYRLPVVADIMTRYEEIDERRRKDRANFVSLWNSICDLFPDGWKYTTDIDCTNKVKELTEFDGDYKQAHEKLEKIWHRANSYVENTDPNKLDFKKFLGVGE